jgi:hypothetical protein
MNRKYVLKLTADERGWLEASYAPASRPRGKSGMPTRF